jgi:hypothetical protein
MMERVQQRVQTISHEFNAQNTASTLWALARLGEPQVIGERMLALLYLRAEEKSAQLNAQVNPNFTCITSTKVQILTLTRLAGRCHHAVGACNTADASEGAIVGAA